MKEIKTETFVKSNPEKLGSGRTNKIIYWGSTIWLALGMLSSGTLQLFRVEAEGALAPPGVDGITQLGYPIYFLTILSIWKILGVVAVLIPKFPLLKEWAYAGFFFAMTGAAFSHIASGHSMIELFPSLLLLILTVVSWYFRPADRKIVSGNQTTHRMNPVTTTEKLADALKLSASEH